MSKILKKALVGSWNLWELMEYSILFYFNRSAYSSPWFFKYLYNHSICPKFAIK